MRQAEEVERDILLKGIRRSEVSYATLTLTLSYGTNPNPNPKLSSKPNPNPNQERTMRAQRLESGALRRLRYVHWAAAQLLCVGPVLPLHEARTSHDSLLLTTYYSPLTTYCLFTTCCFTTHHLPLTAHCSLLTAHCLLFTACAYYLLLTTYHVPRTRRASRSRRSYSGRRTVRP